MDTVLEQTVEPLCRLIRLIGNGQTLQTAGNPAAEMFARELSGIMSNAFTLMRAGLLKAAEGNAGAVLLGAATKEVASNGKSPYNFKEETEFERLIGAIDEHLGEFAHGDDVAVGHIYAEAVRVAGEEIRLLREREAPLRTAIIAHMDDYLGTSCTTEQLVEAVKAAGKDADTHNRLRGDFRASRA